MLSFKLHIASESRTYCCLLQATSSSPPLPVKAGWRGRSPSLDATLRLAAVTYCGNAYASQFFAFSNHGLGVTEPAVPDSFGMLQNPCGGSVHDFQTVCRDVATARSFHEIKGWDAGLGLTPTQPRRGVCPFIQLIVTAGLRRREAVIVRGLRPCACLRERT